MARPKKEQGFQDYGNDMGDIIDDDSSLPKDISFSSFLARHLDRISQAKFMGMTENYNGLIDSFEMIITPYIDNDKDLRKRLTELKTKILKATQAATGTGPEIQKRQRILINVLYERKLGIITSAMYKPGLLGAQEAVAVDPARWADMKKKGLV